MLAQCTFSELMCSLLFLGLATFPSLSHLLSQLKHDRASPCFFSFPKFISFLLFLLEIPDMFKLGYFQFIFIPISLPGIVFIFPLSLSRFSLSIYFLTYLFWAFKDFCISLSLSLSLSLSISISIYLSLSLSHTHTQSLKLIYDLGHRLLATRLWTKDLEARFF